MVSWTLSPFNSLSELKIMLNGISQNYVGKTTVVSAVDVAAATSTKSPIHDTAVGVVATGFMTSAVDGSIESTSPAHSGCG